MADTKNALAELAERLYKINDYNRYPTIGELNDIREAQRIIKELAKRNISSIPTDCYGCGVLKTLANCRAIAEDEE